MNETQYEHVQKLLQCGHAYAKMSDYIATYKQAVDKMTQAGTRQEYTGWFGVCVIVRELTVLRFGEMGRLELQHIAEAHAKQK